MEQTIDELLNGHDFDHLVSYRLHPNRIAVGFRLLARNVAIGLQLATAQPSLSAIRGVCDIVWCSDRAKRHRPPVGRAPGLATRGGIYRRRGRGVLFRRMPRTSTTAATVRT